jgi:hypothetical protein
MVCDVPERDHQDWLDAWTRVWKRSTVNDLYERKLVDELTVRLVTGTKALGRQFMDSPASARPFTIRRTLPRVGEVNLGRTYVG